MDEADQNRSAIEKSMEGVDEVYRKFRRALRRSDQVVLDDLFARAREQVALEVVNHGTWLEALLLAMLLEEHKEVQRLRSLTDQLHGDVDDHQMRL